MSIYILKSRAYESDVKRVHNNIKHIYRGTAMIDTL